MLRRGCVGRRPAAPGGGEQQQGVQGEGDAALMRQVEPEPEPEPEDAEPVGALPPPAMWDDAPWPYGPPPCPRSAPSQGG